MADTVQGRYVLLEQSAVWRGLSRVLFAAVPVMLLSYALWHVAAGMFGVHLLAIAFLFRRWQRLQNFGASPHEHAVNISAKGVVIDGELAIPRDRIADGHFQPRLPRSTVRLFDKHRAIVFEAMTDEEDGEKMLRALGLDASRKRAVFNVTSPIFASQGKTIALVFGLFMATNMITTVLHRGIAPLIMLPILFATAFWPRKVEVGVDGVLIRWAWQKRFIPMSEIQDVYGIESRALTILLRSGEGVTIATGTAKARGEEPLQKRDAIIARIKEAKAARGEGARVDVAALVQRGARAHGDWLKAVKDLRSAAGYRTAVVRDEDLWALVEDPAAAEDVRAGAAVALRSALDDEGKERVRIAAEATVSPRLRIALDAAAGESDEAAEQALVELGKQA